MDTENLEADLLKKNWATYAVSKDSAKGRLIISIISMELGKKCQDQYMEDQIAAYAKSIEKTYGSMPDTAMMECINILHQGGFDALKRILSKTPEPYTAEQDLCNTVPGSGRPDAEPGRGLHRQAESCHKHDSYIC